MTVLRLYSNHCCHMSPAALRKSSWCFVNFESLVYARVIFIKCAIHVEQGSSHSCRDHPEDDQTLEAAL